MTDLRRPDLHARDLGALAYTFQHFGEYECPLVEARIYQELCRGIRGDRELLELAARARANQPARNMLFGAVHYLLLGGDPKGDPEERAAAATDPLREWYPALAQGPVRSPETAFEPFRSFCLAHRDRIEPLLATRIVQTNVVQRCSGLLPAFARVHREGNGRPLALVEIGPSAGLNLQWSRFRYEYDDGTTWGDPDSPVEVPCVLRGQRGLPWLPSGIPVVWRRGVDIHPVDVTDPDAVQWLRALVWPDHPGRQERLSAAIEVARRDPPVLVEGDAAVELPALLEAAPADASVCVYGTHTLYQFPREALIATLKAMQAASAARTLHFVSIEGTGDRCSELRYTVYAGGSRDTRVIANCNAHGRWLEWLAD